MASRFLAINRLMKNERLAVGLLRGARCKKLDSAESENFDALRRTALGRGLSISPPISPYIGQDEARLLAWLAGMQRQKPVHDYAMPVELSLSLKACSASLKAIGIWLDFRAITRCFAAAEPATPALMEGLLDGLPQGQRTHPAHLSPSAAVQARVLVYVRDRGEAATKDLVCLGISRQLISAMTKRGLLRRIRHGVCAMHSRAMD